MIIEPSKNHDQPKIGSERSFGLVIIVVFLLLAAWPMLTGGRPLYWALGVAGAFLLASLAAPRLLTPLNRVWFHFGNLLARIVTPIVLGVIFFLTVMPIGLIMRLARKDLLRLRPAPDQDTYWLPRDGSRHGAMTDQF